MSEEVEIPEEYYDKFEERAPDKGFDSAEEYIHYVLGQIYEKLQAQENGKESEYSEEEAEKVKEKLRGLGYME